MPATKTPRGGERTNHDPVVREELVGLGEELSSLDDGVCRRVGQRIRIRIKDVLERKGEDEPGRPVPTVRASCSSVQKKGWNSKLVGRIPEGDGATSVRQNDTAAEGGAKGEDKRRYGSQKELALARSCKSQSMRGS